jgi:hypothetical protein
MAVRAAFVDEVTSSTYPQSESKRVIGSNIIMEGVF